MSVPAVLANVILAAAAHAGAPDTATISGTIVRITAAERDGQGGILGRVEVEYARGSLVLNVTAKSKVEKADGKERRSCAFGELRAGDRIEAVCSPEFAASDPPQTSAQRLVVLSAAK